MKRVLATMTLALAMSSFATPLTGTRRAEFCKATDPTCPIILDNHGQSLADFWATIQAVIWGT